MTRDDPARDVGHPRLYLAGDFGSPAEVMAASSLDDDQKRDVLGVWHRDLMNSGGWAEHKELLSAIDEALTRLGGKSPSPDEPS